jgi:hypothetical protein
MDLVWLAAVAAFFAASAASIRLLAALHGEA